LLTCITDRSHHQEILVSPRELINLHAVCRVIIAIVRALSGRNTAPPRVQMDPRPRSIRLGEQLSIHIDGHRHLRNPRAREVRIVASRVCILHQIREINLSLGCHPIVFPRLYNLFFVPNRRKRTARRQAREVSAVPGSVVAFIAARFDGPGSRVWDLGSGGWGLGMICRRLRRCTV
jgi:hypothetical protein